MGHSSSKDLEESSVVFCSQQWEDGPHNLSQQGSSGWRDACPGLQISSQKLFLTSNSSGISLSSQYRFWNILSPQLYNSRIRIKSILYKPAGFRLYLKTSQNTSLLGSLQKGSRNMAGGTRYMSLLEPSDLKVLEPSKFHLGNSSMHLGSESEVQLLQHSPSAVPSIQIYIAWTFLP